MFCMHSRITVNDSILSTITAVSVEVRVQVQFPVLLNCALRIVRLTSSGPLLNTNAVSAVSITLSALSLHCTLGTGCPTTLVPHIRVRLACSSTAARADSAASSSGPSNYNMQHVTQYVTIYKQCNVAIISTKLTEYFQFNTSIFIYIFFHCFFT